MEFKTKFTVTRLDGTKEETIINCARPYKKKIYEEALSKLKNAELNEVKWEKIAIVPDMSARIIDTRINKIYVKYQDVHTMGGVKVFDNMEDAINFKKSLKCI